MLRASHLCAPSGVPMLGINLGRLGFLMQFSREKWHTALEHLLKGEFWIENRMMLRAEHLRSGDSLGNWHALNEAAVARRPSFGERRWAPADQLRGRWHPGIDSDRLDSLCTGSRGTHPATRTA